MALAQAAVEPTREAFLQGSPAIRFGQRSQLFSPRFHESER